MGTDSCECEEKAAIEEEPVIPPTSALSRRSFMKYLLTVTGVSFLVSMLSPLKMLIPPKKVVQYDVEVDNTFKYAKMEGTWFSEKAGEEVKADDFETGMGAVVIWRKTIPTILIKLDPAKLNISEGVDQGFVAICAKCTHLCCIANWHIDRPDMDMIFCRCHEGILDPHNIVEETDENGNVYYGAKVVAGPVPRAMPMVPVEILEGKVKGIPSNLEWYDYC